MKNFGEQTPFCKNPNIIKSAKKSMRDEEQRTGVTDVGENDDLESVGPVVDTIRIGRDKPDMCGCGRHSTIKKPNKYN